MDTTLPPAFDPQREPHKALAKVKASVSKKFSWTKRQPLFDTLKLAVLLLVYGRQQEAYEICETLGRLQFDGSFNLWSAVERALTLQARLARQRGDIAVADDCVRRVRAAGFVDTRLDGEMLDPNGALEQAIKDGDRKWEQLARLGRASELAFIIELGGSAACPIASLEQDWADNMNRLRQLVGVDGAAPQKD